MTHLSSHTPGAADGAEAPGTDASGADAPDPAGPPSSGEHASGGGRAAAQSSEQAERAEQAAEVPTLPVFVDDPIVPLRLRLPGTIRHTLYHPGWFAIEEGEESQAFLGVPGEALYGFERLTHLVDYMRTRTPTGLAPGPDLAEVEAWTADEYARRLCDYDMVAIPELADGELSPDEQGSVGSMLAVGLDLVDFLRIGGEHADALRQDPDISKLASGDEVLSIFAAGRHRHHVVEMITQHWGPCMAAVAARTTAPRAER